LVVDDEEELREAIAFDFRRKKLRVLAAGCGRDAIKILEAEKVDVVLTDMRMPHGGGAELLDWIKARDLFSPPVIIVTGLSELTLEEAYNKGAEAVFAKPFDRKMLFAAVERALQPVEQRLGRGESRLEAGLSVGIDFLGSGLSVKSRLVNIGRGGFFVALERHFPRIQEEVAFRIDASTGAPASFSGRGLVRWIRKEARKEGPPGCGVEFTQLDPASVRNLVLTINYQKTKSFIPLR
jgi:CheY-like chemotaxis protein